MRNQIILYSRASAREEHKRKNEPRGRFHLSRRCCRARRAASPNKCNVVCAPSKTQIQQLGFIPTVDWRRDPLLFGRRGGEREGRGGHGGAEAGVLGQSGWGIELLQVRHLSCHRAGPGWAWPDPQRRYQSPLSLSHGPSFGQKRRNCRRAGWPRAAALLVATAARAELLGRDTAVL